MKRTIKIFKTIFIALAILYLFSYAIFSRISMYDNTLGGGRKTVWAFGPLAQQLHIYSDKEGFDYKSELVLRVFYWPLIKADKYIFGNYHVLEDNLPNLGG